MIPKYRGAAPIQWAIADGLKETGVSIIEVEKVSRGYDVGDIWAQRSVAIPEGATYSALAPLLAKQGSELLVQVLRDMIKGTVSRTHLSLLALFFFLFLFFLTRPS